MERWERRERKLKAKRRRMRVRGRGLLTVIQLIIQKRVEEAKRAGRDKNPSAYSAVEEINGRYAEPLKLGHV